MKRIALYHLETLLWIAKLGTFGAAATRLNTSQPAISARVREIEQQLGVELFRRHGRTMILTARGRRLVQDCEAHWAGLERALLGASDFAGAAGLVRIGAGEIAAASCLPGFVQAIERELPAVTLEVELDLTARLLERVLTGIDDIVFLAGPVASPGIRTAPIGSVALIWAASPETAAKGGFARPLPVWSLASHSPLYRVTRDALADGHLPHRALSTCNNVRTMIQIIAHGGGAAVLPETMVRAELASGALVEILPRPARQIEFEVAIRASENDPLIQEMFRRAGSLWIG
ncbi:LysR family transcriptional regulator [Sphingobium subterraneum]|uniref:DNA-binding transcriptional LysR family regulator n=1 Tax=Sphingobium subterraneum TaxID=627688 RepID=A0A841IVT8_9SPHN|nr:LysR family transcriptional regulator [Sphingobium subterraneum]MBB6123029.1 DNA-binding transcriptional LysR family regulator [Sphingobium subterraneum]